MPLRRYTLLLLVWRIVIPIGRPRDYSATRPVAVATVRLTAALHDLERDGAHFHCFNSPNEFSGRSDRTHIYSNLFSAVVFFCRSPSLSRFAALLVSVIHVIIYGFISFIYRKQYMHVYDVM